MAVEIIVQGGSFALHHSESFNKTRHRCNQAKKLIIDYENGNAKTEDKFQPFHLLSFKTEDDDGNVGRVSVDPAKVIAVASDDEKDSGSDDDD